MWLPRDWTPTPRCPLLIAMDDAPDWRATGQLFRNASAGRPQVILAPNIAVHSTDSLVEWIGEISDECGGGGSYFVCGRCDASAVAMSLVLRECAVTAAVALVSPTAQLASALDATHVNGERVPVRWFFGAQDPQLAVYLDEWRVSAAAARRAGFGLLDIAVIEGDGASRAINETLQFFDDVRVSAVTRA
ncbi:MAG: hypothetical protein AUH43_01230 [Acidobacteria bacterium 13_1_40CM_65_14]|nr:MAG: hypothetical protein AUH43_01230 [Acidobacteria bacterium 13_1_40CM_65_14]